MHGNVASLLLRQFSHAPIFKLRHLKDLNLTQLIHLFRDSFITENDNKKIIDSNNDSNCNINSNSSINLPLYYSIIERVFQIDGECLVIWLSTLIDGKKQKRKKQKKLSTKENPNPIRREEKEGTTLLLSLLVLSNNREQRDDKCKEDVLKRLKQICLFNNEKSLNEINSIHIDNGDDRNGNKVILILSLYLSNCNKECDNEDSIGGEWNLNYDNEKCIDYVLTLLSKLLRRSNNERWR